MIKKLTFIDIETSSLKPEEGEIKLVAFATDDGEVKTTTTLDEELRALLSDKSITKVFHNAKFDVGFLEYYGYKVNNYDCTLVMAQVLKEEKLSLKFLTQKYFGVELDKQMQESENWEGVITENHIEYVKNDVIYTRKLYYKLMDLMEGNKLLKVYEREKRALPAIVMLEMNGLNFEFENWNLALDEDRILSEALEKRIQETLNNSELNLNSPKQLIEAISEYGIKLYSTADSVLAMYSDEHEVIKNIRKFRKLKAKIKTYGENLKSFITDDGKLKSEWQLIGTKSGRMSCKKAPLQAMPSKSRQFFVPSKGYKFICADYSQIELRVLASISGDSTLTNYFKEEIDLHTGTASLIFNKDLKEVSTDERKIAKSLNFGIVYGITAYGIQRNLIKNGLEVTVEEAEEYRLTFLESYKDVRELQQLLLGASTISTLGGRVWKASDLTMNQRLNLPIQGSASEGLKEALALLLENMKEAWKLLAVVHDEILIEVPEEDAEEAKQILEQCMINGMKKIVKNVPITVESTISDTWAK